MLDRLSVCGCSVIAPGSDAVDNSRRPQPQYPENTDEKTQDTASQTSHMPFRQEDVKKDDAVEEHVDKENVNRDPPDELRQSRWASCEGRLPYSPFAATDGPRQARR